MGKPRAPLLQFAPACNLRPERARVSLTNADSGIVMADVFISYARTDRRRVKLVAQGLAAEGFTVWWDPEILPGKKFDEVIRRELEQSIAVVTCWTRAAAQSKWVLAETSFADGQKKLATAQLQTCDPPIPYNMLHFAELARWRGDADDPEWLSLLAAVKAIVKARRTPFAAAPPPPGEAEAATAPPVETPPPVYEAERYVPSSQRSRAGGDRSGRFVASLVLTALLTLGVLAGSELLGQVRDAVLGPPPPTVIEAPPPAPETLPQPVAPLDAAPVEARSLSPATIVLPPVIRAPALPRPMTEPARTPIQPDYTAPSPVTSAPLPPAPDPRKPWTDLDACAQKVAAQCAWRRPRDGFADDGLVSPQEGAFLWRLGVDIRTIDASTVQRCEALLSRPSNLRDSAGRPTPLGSACGSLSPAAKAALSVGGALIVREALAGGSKDRPTAQANPQGAPQASRGPQTTPASANVEQPPKDPVVR
jgi:hypothetical protein